MAFEWQDHHFISGRPCLDLVNTVVYARDPTRREDRLGDPDETLGWMAAATSAPLAPAGGYAGERLHLGAREARAAFDALFRARAVGEGVAILPWIDLVAAHVESLREQMPHLDAGPEGLRMAADVASAPGFLAMLTHDAMSLALSPAVNRIKECPGCNWLFVDRSRNGRKRWCAMETCGNRAKARRYGERRRQAVRA